MHNVKNSTSCCVIVAAGLSSRMGRFKPLLPIAGKPAIVFLIGHLLAAGVDTCVVVTGHRGDEIRSACAAIPDIIWGENADYATTDMFASVKIGFSLVPETCTRILMTPADIPLIQKETIRSMLDTDAPLAFPVYQGRKSHPLSLSPVILPQILNWNGEMGLKGAFSSLDIAPALIPTDDPFGLMDMDTPEDYEKLLSYVDQNSLF